MILPDRPDGPPTPAPASSLSTSLIERAKRGDPDGLGGLVYLYLPLVLRLCNRAGLPEPDAEEVAREVFRAIAAEIADFPRRMQGLPFRAWLIEVARDKIGERARGVLAPIPEGESSSDAGDEDVQARGLLCRRALEVIGDEYPPETRQAAWRVLVEAKGPAEVAADLGMTPNAVHVAKSRVLARLREILADLGESEFFAGEPVGVAPVAGGGE